jgi:hypothetical protein
VTPYLLRPYPPLRRTRAAWAGLLVLVLLLHATLGRGLHELQHLGGSAFGARTADAHASVPDQPDDAPGSHAACAWCLSQAHAAPGGETPRAVAPPSRPLRVFAARPAAPIPDTSRWPFAARDPPHALG